MGKKKEKKDQFDLASLAALLGGVNTFNFSGGGFTVAGEVGRDASKNITGVKTSLVYEGGVNASYDSTTGNFSVSVAPEKADEWTGQFNKLLKEGWNNGGKK